MSMAHETSLKSLKEKGGSIQTIRGQDALADEDMAAILTLRLRIPRPAKSAIFIGQGPSWAKVMLFDGQEPKFESTDEVVVTLDFQKRADGAWSATKEFAAKDVVVPVLSSVGWFFLAVFGGMVIENVLPRSVGSAVGLLFVVVFLGFIYRRRYLRWRERGRVGSIDGQ
jgi:hypothetical protein